MEVELEVSYLKTLLQSKISLWSKGLTRAEDTLNTFNLTSERRYSLARQKYDQQKKDFLLEWTSPNGREEVINSIFWFKYNKSYFTESLIDVKFKEDNRYDFFKDYPFVLLTLSKYGDIYEKLYDILCYFEVEGFLNEKVMAVCNRRGQEEHEILAEEGNLHSHIEDLEVHLKKTFQ